LFIYRIFRVLE